MNINKKEIKNQIKEAEKYDEIAIELWGDRAEQSIKLWKSYSVAQKEEVIEECNRNYLDMVQLIKKGKAIDSQEMQVLVRKWHEYLFYYYEPSLEILTWLADAYKNHPEFREYYEKIDSDLPDFFSSAITHYVDVLETKWLESQYLTLEE